MAEEQRINGYLKPHPLDEWAQKHGLQLTYSDGKPVELGDDVFLDSGATAKVVDIRTASVVVAWWELGGAKACRVAQALEPSQLRFLRRAWRMKRAER